MLEPCAGKLARTVLRREEAGNSFFLSDLNGLLVRVDDERKGIGDRDAVIMG